MNYYQLNCKKNKHMRSVEVKCVIGSACEL